MTLLNIKSQEISRLESLLLVEQAKMVVFVNEIEALKAAVARASSTPELPAISEQSVQEKAAWEKERSFLMTSLTSEMERKERAEKDRDFFREQYSKASGFISSVRAENDELEERVRVAEDQAKTGVDLIKRTFEQRVKSLEGDASSWKRVALFAVEKDARTNDVIRRRAAEEPQLRARVEELEEENQRMVAHMTMIEDDLESQESRAKELEVDNTQWKREIARLNTELHLVNGQLERVGKTSEGEGGKDPNEMIYQCCWRQEEGNLSCGGVFTDIEVCFFFIKPSCVFLKIFAMSRNFERTCTRGHT